MRQDKVKLILKDFIKGIALAVLFIGFSSCGGFKSSSKNKSSEPIRLMSYNIRIASPPSLGWGNTELDSIARVIRENQPDLVALQEVDAFTERSGVHSDQARELGEKTGMHYYFSKAVDRSGGDYGVALLSAFPITKTFSYKLSVVEGSSGETRGLGLIQVELPGGQELIFGTVHLDHRSDADRAYQVEQVVNHTRKWDKTPLIIGSDLNMTPDNKVMEMVRKYFILGCETCPLTFPQINPKRTIDYIFMNKAAAEMFSISDYKTVKEDFASDHLPVTATLRKK